MSRAKRRKGFAKAVLHNNGIITPAQLSTIVITAILDGWLYYTQSGTAYRASLTTTKGIPIAS